MKRCTLDKIASVTLRLRLSRNAVLGETIPPVEGAVVACRVLNAKTSYNHLEDVHGRMVALHPGDVIAGALGHRNALHGFSGRVPSELHVGDELQLLNLGGVLGVGARPAPGVGEPFRLEVLGSVLEFPSGDRRHGEPAIVGDAALPHTATLPPPDELPPVIALVGTSMNSGKTTAACALIGALHRSGQRVAAGKLTGVSLRRDVLEMADCGASPIALFTDFGVVTTSGATAPRAARSLLAHLVAADALDHVVLEMGDGLLGTYGVAEVLADDMLRGTLRSVILCANDPVGVWGGVRILEEEYGLRPDAISGPVTDSAAGRTFCEGTLGIPCWNALRDGDAIVDLVAPAESLRAADGVLA